MIIDDEAVTASRPMDDGIIVLAFSVEHYSELILRYVKAKRVLEFNLYEARK